MTDKTPSLKTSVLVPLAVPIEVTAEDGKPAKRETITVYRPTFKQAKALALVIGPNFFKALMANGPTGMDSVDPERLVTEMVSALATEDGLDRITDVLAEMTRETPEVIDRLDWSDLVPVGKAFLDFFPALQSTGPSS